MKTSVIICEFNPLHSGHTKLIQFAKSFSDAVVCVMSGNFVQRGIPACCNKQKRALHALKAGANLVVELPTVFAVSSAENFALGGVKLADALQCDFLVFGSESGNLDCLSACADMLDDPLVNERIQSNLSLGVNYPQAVANAFKAAATNGADCAEILGKPNNILAAEYLRALKRTRSQIVPVTIKRPDNYGSQSAPNFDEACRFVSSSALRQNSELRQKFTYDFVSADIDDNIEERYKKFATRFLSLKTAAEIAEIEGVTEGLQNRIFAADKTRGFEAMTEEIKTKRYTRLKLQRIFLNCVLDIKKCDVAAAKQSAAAPWALGASKGFEQLLEYACAKPDEITQKADRLYAALEGATPSKKLIVF